MKRSKRNFAKRSRSRRPMTGCAGSTSGSPRSSLGPRPTAGAMPSIADLPSPAGGRRGVRGPDRDRRRGDEPPRTDRGYEPWLADGMGPGGGPGASTDEGRHDADTRASVRGPQPGDGLPVRRGPRVSGSHWGRAARTSPGVPSFAVRMTRRLPGAQPPAASRPTSPRSCKHGVLRRQWPAPTS